MKNLRRLIVTSFTIVLIAIIYSCTSDTEYLKFVKDGEISYTAAIDSLKILPGHNRVKLQGLIIGDPKVSEVRVYWNSNKDSISIPVNRISNVSEVSSIIDDLDENIYNFVVKTFDAEGNSSIPVSKTAEVYGDRYIASLFNRPVITNIPVNNNLTITYGSMDLTANPIGTEVVYTSTTDVLKTIFIPISESNFKLTDYKSETTYSYRTVFVPEGTSIDNFYSDYVADILPRPVPVLENAVQPFIAVSGQSGRFRDLASPWIANAAAKSHAGFGGWDEGCCTGRENTMNLESGWGQPSFTNAKIYQTTKGDATTYQLKVDIINTNYVSGSAYLVVALGDGIPDRTAVTTAPEVLVYHAISSSGVKTLEFTLSSISQISVGIVATQTSNNNCNIKSWSIIKK